MHATASLLAVLSVVAATPYYYPQQRQLFYPVVPQSSQFSQYSQYSQFPQYVPRQVYYAPPAAANLVAPVPAVRYPAAASPAKYGVYYNPTGVAPYPNLVYSGADEGAEEGSYWGTFLESISSHFPAVWPASGNAEAEGGSAEAAGGSSPAASPEKIEQASNSEKPAKEGEESEKEKEEETEKPEQPANPQKVKAALKGVPQKFVVLGQPQFFGNFGLQRVNPAAVLPSADHGAVSSYLLLKNYPGYRFGPQFPVVPQVPQLARVPQPHPQAQPAQPPQADSADAELIPAGQPGVAALGYQKLLKEAAAEAARQSKEYDDAAVVEAADDAKDSQDAQDKPESATDADADKNEEETGTASE